MAVLQYLMMGRSGTDRQVITGELHVYGKNVRGQAGTGDDVLVSDPTQIGSLTDWQNTMQPAYANNVGSVKSDGTLWMQGRGGSGQLGQGNTTNYSSPVQVGVATDWLSPGPSLKVEAKLYGAQVPPLLSSVPKKVLIILVCTTAPS